MALNTYQKRYLTKLIYLFQYSMLLSASQRVGKYKSWCSSEYWNKTGLTLQWRHNGHDRVSNHQPHDCLLKRLFRRRSKHQSSASLAFVWGIQRWPVNSPNKWPVARKMFPFHDVILNSDKCIVIHLVHISLFISKDRNKWHRLYLIHGCRQTSNISRTLAGNITVDHSDVVGAAPHTSSFST